MSYRTIEQQLKKNEWIHNFQQESILDQLIQEASEILPRGRQIISLTYGNQVKSNGTLSEIWWVILLTNREIILVESLLDDEKWRGTPKMVNFDDIKIINGKRSKGNSQILRINIVTNNQSWTFETLDLDSGLHFVDQAETLIVEGFHDLAAVLKTQEFNDLEIIDERKKSKKHHKIFNYFFNFNSLLKSTPSLRALFLASQIAWLVCNIIYVALWGANKLDAGAALGLGLVMVIFNLLSIVWVLANIVNVWEKHTITPLAHRLFLLEGLLIMLFITSILISVNSLTAPTFAVIGLFTSLYVLVEVSLELVKGIREIDNPEKEHEKNFPSKSH
ncbi:hypothetical protein JN01_0476 [Entomoplasma freundtii]|uniref:Uncharacterized protein n=1 Tax=Entomoplasma freundtii TaxID=74700 RepID=A0A2K8NQR2_9MOLU|nr:hypothetical protein [Entomoplasma freundtii]ATZ16124.1 hypothetical protein EFREU_v1c00970 [Entomoplasma freundtii]TDY56975.1 hypothetical protein JN01_0476 [Entomoplasma freundtii]